MRKILDQINLNLQYSKAKISFEHCVANKDNEFLNYEIDVSISEITTKNESVKIEFSGNDNSQYTIETLLLLFTSDDKKIGYYCYSENEKEQVVDDYLVFE